MPNNINVHQMIAREAAAMLTEEAPFLGSVNRGRDSDFQQKIHGYAQGQSVDITVPPTPVVFDGAVFAGGSAAPDASEGKVRLTLDVQKHTAMTLTDIERTLFLSDDAMAKKRFLKPHINALASQIETVMIQKAMQATPNYVGTAGSIPTTMATYNQARGKLQQFLAPNTDRSIIISTDANNGMVDASKALFHAQDEVEEQYMEGRMGRASGFDWYESQNLATQTNGTQASWTVNGASQTGTSLAVGGLTSGQTILKGTVFTIAGVRATHPITGVAYPAATLRQFVVTADFTAAGTTGTISIFPAITPTTSTLIGTVNASPANAAACTPLGAASAALRQNLAFQKDAFAVAFAPLPSITGTDSYTASLNGVSVRVLTFGDGANSRESTRVDVLCGFAAVRPDHACRITE